MARAAFEEPEFEPNSPLSWTQGECVGAGSYGKVYKCHFGNNHILAVKIVQMERQYSKTQKEVEALNNEIHILKKLRHERIVSYYGSEQKDDQLHLFMEFMAGGSLSDQIKRKGLPEPLSKRYTKQLLEGVVFLHSQDIIHRDIKGSNVLLDGVGNVKLADFGLSKMIEKVGSKTNLATSCGTSYWMAPEILWGQGYGRKADIWSLGCTVVEMLTGKPPLGHLEPHAAMFSTGTKPLDLTLPESVSNEAKSFIEAALTWKPDERPWSHELQRYAFVSNRNQMEEKLYDLREASYSIDLNLSELPPYLEDLLVMKLDTPYGVGRHEFPWQKVAKAAGLRQTDLSYYEYLSRKNESPTKLLLDQLGSQGRTILDLIDILEKPQVDLGKIANIIRHRVTTKDIKATKDIKELDLSSQSCNLC